MRCCGDTCLKRGRPGSWLNRRPSDEERVDVPRSADLGARAKLFTIKAPCHICLTFRIGAICCPAAECQLERRRVRAGRARRSEALPKVRRNLKSKGGSRCGPFKGRRGAEVKCLDFACQNAPNATLSNRGALTRHSS